MEIPVAKVYSSTKIKVWESIFALPQFLYLEAQYNFHGVPKYLKLEFDHEEILLPIIISTVKKSKVHLFSKVTCPAPPQKVEGSVPFSQRESVIRELANYLRRNYRCKMVLLVQRPSDPQFIGDNINGWMFSKHYDVMVDLSPNLEKIYLKMEKRHRYAIRKIIEGSDFDALSDEWLQKTKFSVKEGKGFEDLLEFRKLWTGETLRKVLDEYGPTLGDPWPLERIRNTFNLLQPLGLCKMFTMYDESQNAGASMIIYTSRNFTKVPMAFWSIGAASIKGKKKGLALLLQWYVIRWLKNHGYTQYFMGGYKGIKHGPSLFKKGFGEIVSGFNIVWFAPILSIGRRIAEKFPM